jgi:tetratricopeptide (TPR) repeat protein
MALYGQRKYGAAEAAFRKALALKPDYALAHNNLGITLVDQKRFGDAVAAYCKAAKLLPGNLLIQRNLRRAERWLELDKRLPAILAGKENPSSPTEWIAFAAFCADYKHHYLTAYSLYSAAFAADPKLADELNSGNRYNAACCAARAAASRSEDAKGIAVEEWAWLQGRALHWLRADLNALANLVEKGDKESRQFVQQRLSHWLKDDDLAVVRDQAWLAAMPETDRGRWQRLWADVRALLKQITDKK